MYNSQNIASRIKSAAKSQGKSLGEILIACGLSKNTVAKINQGADILTLNFAKIADQLDCSIDYLLGRAEIPDAIYSESIDIKDTDYIITASKRETRLLIDFRNLNTQGKEYILQTMDMVNDKYKKDSIVSNMEDIG